LEAREKEARQREEEAAQQSKSLALKLARLMKSQGFTDEEISRETGLEMNELC
jgi:predicted transposase YdaD